MRTDRTIRVAIARVAVLSLVTAVAVGLAGTPTATATPSGAGARFATYNIHAGAGTDHVFDLDRTAAAIRALEADVVGLEEADVHWGERSQWQDTVSELGRRLGMQVGFAPIYSLDPVIPGDPRRANQVLLGDFNAEADAPELAPLWDVLRDGWAVAPVRTGEPGLTYPAIDPTKRIDFVTVSPHIAVRDAQTQSDPGLLGASDHRAVVATVLLDQGSEPAP